MISASSSVLYYIHDPMCSWCWAYRPVLLQLRENLPEGVHWQTIQSTVGTEFNFDFWIKCQPRRDTYKACRAVIAASWQQAGEAMIGAIQKAYYLRAMNPPDPETLANAAFFVSKPCPD